jgi:hypothetical protein
MISFWIRVLREKRNDTVLSIISITNMAERIILNNTIGEENVKPKILVFCAVS